MRRLRDYSLCLCLLLLWPLAVNADDSWRQIQTEARGQTVWFNARGGDPAVNRYLAWVSEEVKRYYAIDLRIVPVADAADAVKRIQTEAQAGRRRGGSVDLLWINGENFRTLKQANLLLTGWAESLPNWRYVDLQKPVREDFSVATEGAESPWGSAQLTFIARRGQTPQPPTSPQALLAFARAHPGSVTYPRPPDFTGTALLEQLLIALTDQPAALRQPPQPATFAAVWPRCGAISMRCTRPCGGRARISRRRRHGWIPCSTMAPSAYHSRLTRCTPGRKPPAANYRRTATASALPRGPSATSISLPSRLTPAPSLEPKWWSISCSRLKRSCARPMPPSGAIRAYWTRSVCLTASVRRWRQPCRRIYRRCLPSRTRHGLTRWSRNGCAATVPTDPAGTGTMAAIYLPLLPAAGELVGAARSPAHWRALFADPQLGGRWPPRSSRRCCPSAARC